MKKYNFLIDFLKQNYFVILKTLAGLFLLYWIIFVLTPKSGLTPEEKNLLDSLSTQVKLLHEDNLKLEKNIQDYNIRIQEIDNNIDKIKNQKTIIKEYYHEKISNVDKLTIRELDSFFTNRYYK